MRYLSYFMRLVLTLAFLAAASLSGAELAVPVSKAVAPTGPLSLEKAIDRTLLFNLGLTVTRLDALRSLDAVEVSESVFDPTFAWTNRINGSRSVADLTGGLAATRWQDSDVALSQKFTWGGTLSVGTGLTRTWTESGNLATASVYELGTNVAYTQPLLAGGWRAVNLSALISSRQAAYRNRLTLRAASSTSSAIPKSPIGPSPVPAPWSPCARRASARRNPCSPRSAPSARSATRRCSRSCRLKPMSRASASPCSTPVNPSTARR